MQFKQTIQCQSNRKLLYCKRQRGADFGPWVGGSPAEGALWRKTSSTGPLHWKRRLRAARVDHVGRFDRNSVRPGGFSSEKAAPCFTLGSRMSMLWFGFLMDIPAHHLEIKTLLQFSQQSIPHSTISNLGVNLGCISDNMTNGVTVSLTIMPRGIEVRISIL